MEQIRVRAFHARQHGPAPPIQQRPGAGDLQHHQGGRRVQRVRRRQPYEAIEQEARDASALAEIHAIEDLEDQEAADAIEREDGDTARRPGEPSKVEEDDYRREDEAVNAHVSAER